jgi:hypothetical protein
VRVSGSGILPLVYLRLEAAATVIAVSGILPLVDPRLKAVATFVAVSATERIGPI